MLRFRTTQSLLVNKRNTMRLKGVFTMLKRYHRYRSIVDAAGILLLLFVFFGYLLISFQLLYHYVHLHQKLIWWHMLFLIGNLILGIIEPLCLLPLLILIGSLFVGFTGSREPRKDLFLRSFWSKIQNNITGCFLRTLFEY